MTPGIWQILIVLAIVLIIFGPSRIPGLGKSIGEAIRGFKKGLSDDEIDVTESSKEQISEGSESEAQSARKKEKQTENS